MTEIRTASLSPLPWSMRIDHTVRIHSRHTTLGVDLIDTKTYLPVAFLIRAWVGHILTAFWIDGGNEAAGEQHELRLDTALHSLIP